MTTHPQHRLAALIGGTPQPSGAIVVGPNVVTASIAGTVRVNGCAIGSWSDPVEELADAYFAVVDKLGKRDHIVERTACPACGAEPGVRCRTMLEGIDMQWTHEARVYADMGMEATR